jgi:hypothetical protein
MALWASGDPELGFAEELEGCTYSRPIILFKGCVWVCGRHQLGVKTSVVLDFGATSGDGGLNIEFTRTITRGKMRYKSRGRVLEKTAKQSLHGRVERYRM